MFREGYGGCLFASCSKTADHFRNKSTKRCFVFQLRSPLCFLISTEMCLSRKLRMRGSYQCCSQASGPEQKGFADALSCVRPTSLWFDLTALAINRDVGLLMPPAGPGAQHGAPGHVAEEERGRDHIKVEEPPAPQLVLSPSPRGFCSACTACFGLAAALRLFWADAVSTLRSGAALGIQTCVCHGGSTASSQCTCSYTSNKSPGSTSGSCIGQKSCLSLWEAFWCAQSSQYWIK